MTVAVLARLTRALRVIPAALPRATGLGLGLAALLASTVRLPWAAALISGKAPVSCSVGLIHHVPIIAPYPAGRYPGWPWS